METRASCKWRSKWLGDGGQLLLSRRLFLASAYPCAVIAQDAEISSFDLSLLDDGAVPTELFFVRNHFPPPSLSYAQKLPITGDVATSIEVSFEEFDSLPRSVLPAVLECAENPVGGGLVSYAEWAGVSLATLLAKVQPRENARFVRFIGADGYFREIPISKAMHPSTLLALRMNGVKLPPAHGFPIRAIVPGWYAMDSVKWLRGIEVVSSEHGAMPTAFRYKRRHRSLLLGAREGDPVTAMSVKSSFSRPVDGAVIMGRRFTIRGVAWAGEGRVRKVEVSVDGGKTWHTATLPVSGHQLYSWVQWQYQWTIPKKGDYELLVRATDESGRTQASERPPDRVDGYELNTCQTVRVAVA